MKVAYWPGCVSRGFTPELHGSMAQVAPLLDLELIELDVPLLALVAAGDGADDDDPLELGADRGVCSRRRVEMRHVVSLATAVQL